ncbi:MAG TPA: hypothetical protein VK752_12655 [Bryobacteraceae bacterium]|nr:hypothetical protein [Bryobacteraceae bacterium]
MKTSIRTREGRIQNMTMAILTVLWLSQCARGASLKEETKEAWNSYLETRMVEMQARLKPGKCFLWLDEHEGRTEHVRTKGPYILSIGDHIPAPAPSGLIHAWLGAGFVPNVTIADILKVIRDYDNYEHVYQPGVLASRLNRADGPNDFFFLRFANRSVVAKTALDCEGEASYFKVDEHRWYAYSNTTRMREIDKFGTPEQRLLPEDEGTGLIWRLSSITRLEERDGGVYAELEAYALSRDIPVALRWFVSPIVRRVSRDSLAASLHQTRVAIDAKKAAQMP